MINDAKSHWFCVSTNNNRDAQIRLESCGGEYSQIMMIFDLILWKDSA